MDLSWSELLVVGIVALIFIGPKDLPGMFRELGRFMAKVRAMGRDFSRAMDQAAKESGVKDVANDLRKVTNPKAMGLDAMRNAADKFEKWDPMKPGASAAPKPAAPLTPPPMPPMPTAAPAVTPAATPVGPATAALAEKVAAKRAASAETVAKLREAKAAPAKAPVAAKPVAEPAPTAEAPAPKRGGRVRKKPAAGAGEDA
ncbi:twin-arginine translocase subunit TatB [Tabrizicola piscis]|uniref:Twin-arginine translocase subunit TatB n=1 Tax=Tabrizicola piscis TaxID=2494374 RepID=A0A3S8U2Y0_9RHOB|nr:Sec-independent protein translocase protein TatB [Tabrizicola piscis]AZL57956.1 twin-arginine translocase subunit TatB [Tabrizicola piscis]